MHGHQTRHSFAAGNAVERMPGHGRDVVSEENAAFLRCPSQNVRIRSASATRFPDAHDVHVWKTSAQGTTLVIVVTLARTWMVCSRSE
jgi:hypothetical protein